MQLSANDMEIGLSNLEEINETFDQLRKSFKISTAVKIERIKEVSLSPASKWGGIKSKALSSFQRMNSGIVKLSSNIKSSSYITPQKLWELIKNDANSNKTAMLYISFP